MRVLLCLLTGAVGLSAATCDSLASLALPSTAITTAETFPGGLFTPPEGRPLPNLPSFCRVAGVIKPSSDSDIRFEVWMPSSMWNGRFAGVGNGGFGGSIDFDSLGNLVAGGYVTAATDTGHHGNVTDATWALGHPEKVTDFGYRAIHETAEKAKALVAAFYGSGPKRSYFSSCSNGGRQALMEAQRYPADYDGIIAGAPANYWTSLLSSGVWQQALLQDPAGAIPPAKLPAIEAAALAACDALDGVQDGVIDNPPACHFDPSKLLCKGPENDSCLTASQLTVLQKLYEGPKDAKGRQIFPGYSPGGQTGVGGWATWITGLRSGRAGGYLFSTQFFSQMVFQDAAWDLHTFNVERDSKTAADRLGAVLNAADPDLKRFQERGGKLIIYHGWSDPAISPLSTVDYFESVEKKMGARNTGEFLRLFMVPGMQHCGGGPGPNSFTAPPDPQHDIRLALEHWVEDGVAPHQIVATKYKGAGPASGIERTRPLCPYPQVAQWKGTGSTDDAANFACVEPKHAK